MTYRFVARQIPRSRIVCRLALLAGVVLAGATGARADIYGWWPLDDGSGDVARDQGPQQEEGLINAFDTDGLASDGSVWVQDPDRGMVLGLAGNSAWVSAGVLPIMDLENQFSWAFWARQDPDQGSPSTDIIIGNRYDEFGADTVPREFIKFTPDRFEYHIDGAGLGDRQYAGLPINEWIHHSVVKQGDMLTYYRNGESWNTRQIVDPMSSPDELPLAFGGQGANVENWRGYLSDVQLYESALTQAEVQSVMTGTALTGRDLYGHWKLDDGPGAADTAADSGPRNEDGLIFDWDVDGLAADGTVWADDPDRGTVLGLGGDTAWVSAGTVPVMDLENDFSWNFWARLDPDQASPSNDIILGNRYDEFGAGTVPLEFIKFTTNRFEYHMNGAGTNDLQYIPGDDPGTTNDIPSNDEWIHHVVVKDGDKLTYYRGGEFRTSRVIEDEMLSPDPLPFAMGGQGDGVENWRGYLSDVRLYDHALTPEEIAEIIGGDLLGDYNLNGELDSGDLDIQAEVIVLGQNPIEFDLTDDGLVNIDDRQVWVNDLKNTWIGDANLDDEFNSSDMVQVFAKGKYEKEEIALWDEGDWNGNQRFESGDMVAAFVAGGYEKGKRLPLEAVSAVPEPTGLVLFLVGLIGLLQSARRH